MSSQLQELAAIHQDLLGIRGMLSRLDPPTTPNTITAISRPWIDEPDGSIPFDEQNGIALPAVGAGETVVLAFIVPEGFNGVIKWLSNNFLGGGFVAFTGDIIWRILADNRPIRNFSNIQAEKGTTNIPREISPIRIYSGQTIQFMVNHVANAALAGQVVCSLVGYIYPASLEG